MYHVERMFTAVRPWGTIDHVSGIWATKFDVTRIGHNGSDPGVRTMMLFDLGREVGVILFTNTSLGGQEMRHYAAIVLELWKHAEAMNGSLFQTETPPFRRQCDIEFAG